MKREFKKTLYDLFIIFAAYKAVSPYNKLALPQLPLLCAITLSLLPLFFKKDYLRWVAALSLNALYGTLFYYGPTFHAVHPWLIGSLFFCSYKFKESDESRWNKYLKETLAVLLLCPYAFSAWHKLWPLMKSLSFSDFGYHLLDNFTYQYLSTKNPVSTFGFYLLKNFPSLILLGSILVLIFQLSSLIGIFRPQYRTKFVFLAFLFHGLTGVFLGINMVLAPLGLYFFIHIFPSPNE